MRAKMKPSAFLILVGCTLAPSAPWSDARAEPESESSAIPEHAAAIDESPDADGEPSWFALPVLSYSQETSLLLGGAVVASRSDPDAIDAKQSSIIAALFYSLRHQWGGSMIGSLYFGRDTWLLDASFSGTRWVDRYFGVGEQPALEGREFDTLALTSEFALSRRVAHTGLYVGGIARVHTNEFHGEAPIGLDNLPGGADSSRALGAGVRAVWEGRDRALWTRRGTFASVSALTYPRGALSDFGFAELDLDLRGFVPLGAEWTLGAQIGAELRAGDVPFYRHATIGGEARVRGSWRGRFRDDAGAWIQTEVRSPHLVWRLAAVGFVGAGAVAPSAASLPRAKWVPGAGAGLRIAVTDDGANIRFDFGATPEESGLYITLGEAF